MKILHIIARFNVGGTATWIANLSEELIEMGHEVIILAGSVERNEIEDLRFEKLNGKRVKGLSRSVSFMNDFRTILELRKMLIAFGPDVINTHTAKAGVVGRVANFLLFSRRFPIVHTIHGHLLIGYFSKFKVRIIISIERILSQITTLVLFAGKKVAADCVEVGIAASCPYRIVKPGLKPITFAKREVLRNQFNISNNDIVIGWLARFTGVKRPDRVVSLAAMFPEVTFIMGGEGELFEPTSIRAPRNCHLIGWIEPENFWKMCDIALLTSENEAVPISLIEAQFASIPALATNAGSTSEVVIQGETGWLVNRDIDALACQLKNILASRDWELLGNNALKNAQFQFTSIKLAADHIMFYQEAIELHKQK